MAHGHERDDHPLRREPQRGIETRLVPPTGFPHTFLDVVGVQRRLDRANLSFAAEAHPAPCARRRAAARPAAPGGGVGRRLRQPARRSWPPAGCASRSSPSATTARPGGPAGWRPAWPPRRAVAFPGLPSAAGPGDRRAAAPGDPVASTRPATAPRRAPSWTCPRDRFVLLVVGGSLGSAALNDVVAGFVAACRGPGDLAVHHVAGERSTPTLAGGAARTRRAGQAASCTDVVGYEDRMPQAYAAADIVLARAGASTVAELTAIGVPSILVPVAGRRRRTTRPPTPAPSAEAGAALLVPEADLTVARLRREVDRVQADPGALAGMAAAARALGAVHRSDALARAGRGGRQASERPQATARPGAAGPLPRRRRRRPGHERHRARRWPRWGTTCRGATSGSCRCSTGCGPPGSPCTSATTPPTSPAWTRSPPPPPSPRPTSSWRRPAGPRIPVLTRAGMLASICAPGRLGGGRRHPRQDDHHVDAGDDPGRRPAGSPATSSAATSTTSARAPTGPEGAGSSSRPTRATAPTSSCRWPGPSSPTSRPTTSTTTAASTPWSTRFDQYLAGIDGPKVLCSDDPITARLAASHDAVTYGTGPEARYQAADVTAAEGSLRFAVRRDGAELGEVAPAAARRAQRAQRARRHRPRRHARRAVRRRPSKPWPASAAWPAASTCGVATTASRSSTTTRTCPTEIAAVLDAAGTSGDGWSRIVAVFQPNRYNRMAVMSPDYRDAFEAADVAVITDIYPSGQAPLPGVTGKLVVDAVCDAHPTNGWSGSRSGGSWCRSWCTNCGRATSASRWAAATSPRCRTRCSPDCSSGAGDERRRGPVAAAIDLAAEVLGPLAERDVPIGPLTTYRVGGAAAAPGAGGRSRRSGRRRPGRGRVRAAGPDRRDAARTCWSPTVASRGWPSCSARGPTRSPSTAPR